MIYEEAFNMKKIWVLAALLLLSLLLLSSCRDKQLDRTYIFGDGVNGAEVTLHEDGSFTFVFSPLSSYRGIGKYTFSGDRLTLETSDGKYRYVFRLTERGIEFDASASSDSLWLGEFSDGSVFEEDIP